MTQPSSDCEIIDLTDETMIEEQTALYERYESERRDAQFAKSLAKPKLNIVSDSHVSSDSEGVIDLTNEEEKKYSTQHRQTVADGEVVKALTVKELLEKSKKRSNENASQRASQVETRMKTVVLSDSDSDIQITSVRPAFKARGESSDDDIMITSSSIRTPIVKPKFQTVRKILPYADFRNLPPPFIPVPQDPRPIQPRTAESYDQIMDRIRHSQALVLESQRKPGNIMASRQDTIKKETDAFQQRNLRHAPPDTFAAFQAQQAQNARDRESQLDKMYKGLQRVFDTNGKEILPNTHNPFNIPFGTQPVPFFNAFQNPNQQLNMPGAVDYEADDAMRGYVPDISAQQAKEDLENLLANVNSYGDRMKPEERIETPQQMTIVLMEHQKLGYPPL